MSAWFPRPATAADVRTIPPPGRWAAAQVYELLNAPEGVEWRDRVGVAGTKDGSGRPSTRLLAVRGWVAKTRVDQTFVSAEEASDRMLASRALGLEAGLWHPDKQWAAIQAGECWYAMTLAPELRTLRQIEGVAERLQAWTEMLRLAIRCHNRHALGLDLNPANFGFANGDPGLYYIDEEVYPALAERDLAGAIVARLPEEPTSDAPTWALWARSLLENFGREPPRDLDLERLSEEVQRYPVAEAFEGRRNAIVDVFRASTVKSARARRVSRAWAEARTTCVFADVHANLPALDAALIAARELGADSYLFLGDVVGYGPHPSECITRLAELKTAIVLRGNHDHAIATSRLDLGMNRLARQCAEWTLTVLSKEELAWLGALPIEHTEQGWMAVHGAPRDPRRFLAYVYELTFEDNLRYLRQRDVPLCFYGHTHVQMVHTEPPSGPTRIDRPRLVDAGQRWATLVNPGSVGQPRDGDPGAAFAIWDRVERRLSFHRVPYALGQTLRDLRARALPEELDRRLAAGT